MFEKNNIFTEINKEDNEIFSKLNKSDLEFLLALINNYKLSLRERINISEDETFGLEIECERADRYKILDGLHDDWILDDDLSLENGAEIKSPVLRDTKENWNILRNMCSMIARHAEVGINAGGHVHVGVQALGNKDQSFINFLKLWAVYEPIIFRFTHGEFLGPRPGMKEAAKSVQVEFLNMHYLWKKKYAGEKEIIHYLCDDKCKAVNFKHYYTLRTFEFRCPNATLDPVIWQNNVNLFIKMLLYSKSPNFNSSIIDEKSRKVLIENKTHNNIYLTDALEFADLIFDNNLDKVYFLRQYLKSFQASDKYEWAKTFTK